MFHRCIKVFCNKFSFSENVCCIATRNLFIHLFPKLATFTDAYTTLSTSHMGRHQKNFRHEVGEARAKRPFKPNDSGPHTAHLNCVTWRSVE